MLRRRRVAAGLAAVAAAGAIAAACGSGADGAGETAPPPPPDPAALSAEITNPWWPMAPGTRWVYRETSPDGSAQRVVVTVTDRTRAIANGATARVVTDVVTEDGTPVEVTEDWYAQDPDGNVWYLGEDTAEYEDGEIVSREGSFEAGVDGAQAGIIMLADPRPGIAYRQEFLEGEAEDRAEVLRLGERVEVAAGRYEGVLVTRDVNPLGEGAVEYTFFVRGVGPVLSLGVDGGGDREELLSVGIGP